MKKERTEFILSILLSLKETYNDLFNFTTKIEKISSTLFEQFYSENQELIDKEINELKQNIEKIKQYNSQITDNINKWYQFVNDSQEQVRLFYPVKFYAKRLRLLSNIKSLNKEIYRTTVENRLSKENLKKIERQIESKILNEIKSAGIYKDYEELLRKKEQLLQDLEYLLPTVSLEIQELDLNNIEKLCSTLKQA
ncbi:MAG: hypothetical protein ACOYJ1_01860 [Peptococcales bacterium]|jgi:hypothetical protein